MTMDPSHDTALNHEPDDEPYTLNASSRTLNNQPHLINYMIHPEAWAS